MRAGDDVFVQAIRHDHGKCSWKALHMSVLNPAPRIARNSAPSPSLEPETAVTRTFEGQVTSVTAAGTFSESQPGVSDIFIPASILVGSSGLRPVCTSPSKKENTHLKTLAVKPPMHHALRHAMIA
jgi:hypothetical protein